MQMKNELRRVFREKRKQISDKSAKDNLICTNILKSDLYKNAKQVLCYYPLADEIDTKLIMNTAIAD